MVAACAFAGYLCTVSRPSPSGPSPCTSLSYARTTMAYLTAWRTLEFRWALACLLSTLLHIPSRLSRVHRIGLKAECCRWRVSPCPFHSQWVGSGRVTLRYVSPIPPLDPYVRLSPHTAHERGILRERSISPAPRCIPHGQLARSLGTCVLFPDPLPQALRRVRSFPTLRLLWPI